MLYLDIHNSILFLSHIYIYNLYLFLGKVIEGSSWTFVSGSASITKVNTIV